MNHDSEVQPPPHKKVKIEHVTTKFDKEFEKCEIMKKWKPDIEKWLELYYKSTNVYKQGWLYSLHQRSVHLMYEEFAQVDDPSYYINYPPIPWNCEDVNRTRTYIYSLPHDEPFRQYFEQADTNNILNMVYDPEMEDSDSDKENVDPCCVEYEP